MNRLDHLADVVAYRRQQSERSAAVHRLVRQRRTERSLLTLLGR